MKGEGNTMIKNAVESLARIVHRFRFEPFASMIQPIIEEVLAEHKKEKCRKGTILTPILTIYLVLGLALRRDLNYHQTLNWLISGFRWESLDLPAKILKDGAISHARGRLGVGVFRDIFYRLVVRVGTVQSDFHGWVTAMFDGTALTMPDTESNREKFGKPRSGRGAGAFPQMRVVALMIMSVRQIFDIAYAPYRGKKTGERTLMLEILGRCKVKNLLILFDAGFYSFFYCLVHETKRA
jgi:hypothetical protein